MKMLEKISKIQRKVFYFIAVSVLISSCAKENPKESSLAVPKISETKGKKVGNLNINKDVVLLQQEDLKNVSEIGDDYVLFSTKPSISKEIKPGSILVGAKTHGGKVEQILGKVIAIEEGSSWLVKTAPIKLEEFIYSGTISGSFSPEIRTKESLMSRAKTREYMLLPVAGFPDYEDDQLEKRALPSASIILPRIAYSDTITIPSTNIPTLSIAPKLALTAGFTPVFDYTIKFERGRVVALEITLHANDLLVDAHLLANAGLEYDLSLSDLYSIPVAPIFLGPTGLILSPTLSAGPYISFKAGADIDAKLFRGQGDVSYVLTNPTQPPVWQINIDPYGWENLKVYPKVEAEGGLQINTGFSLTYIATNVASVQASPRIGLGSVVSSNDNLGHVNHEVFGVLSADARVVFGIPPFQIKPTYPLVSYRPLIYSRTYTLFD